MKDRDHRSARISARYGEGDPITREKMNEMMRDPSTARHLAYMAERSAEEEAAARDASRAIPETAAKPGDAPDQKVIVPGGGPDAIAGERKKRLAAGDPRAPTVVGKNVDLEGAAEEAGRVLGIQAKAGPLGEAANEVVDRGGAAYLHEQARKEAEREQLAARRAKKAKEAAAREAAKRAQAVTPAERREASGLDPLPEEPDLPRTVGGGTAQFAVPAEAKAHAEINLRPTDAGLEDRLTKKGPGGTLRGAPPPDEVANQPLTKNKNAVASAPSIQSAASVEPPEGKSGERTSEPALQKGTLPGVGRPAAAAGSEPPSSMWAAEAAHAARQADGDAIQKALPSATLAPASTSSPPSSMPAIPRRDRRLLLLGVLAAIGMVVVAYLVWYDDGPEARVPERVDTPTPSSDEASVAPVSPVDRTEDEAAPPEPSGTPEPSALTKPSQPIPKTHPMTPQPKIIPPKPKGIEPPPIAPKPLPQSKPNPTARPWGELP